MFKGHSVANVHPAFLIVQVTLYPLRRVDPVSKFIPDDPNSFDPDHVKARLGCGSDHVRYLLNPTALDELVLSFGAEEFGCSRDGSG